MTRILFWLALALLVYFAIRSKLKQSQRRQQQLWEQQREQQQREQQRQSAQREVVRAEPMLRCAQCGVHFPASENVPVGGRDYCSPAHAPVK